MNKIKENYRVDEIKIGHGGDRSVGIPSEYSMVLLSDEMAEILKENDTLQDFKKELFALFKKYNDEVCEVTDDLDEYSSGIYEVVNDMLFDEKSERVKELLQLRKVKQLSKIEEIELFILKDELGLK